MKGKQAPPQKEKRKETKEWKVEDYLRWDLSAEEVKEIKQAFDIFDNDGSGIMDPSELKDAFINLGFTGQGKFVYQILAELDEDQSGGIEFPEFLKLATAKLSDKDSREDVMKVFNAFDVNRAGKFTSLELKKVAKDIGEDVTDEEIESMLQRADLDDDGFVTFEDFYNIMTHKVYWDKK